jgi:hypothetical protein
LGLELEALGWDDGWAQVFAAAAGGEGSPARVVAQYERLESHHKLRRELSHLQAQVDLHARQAEKRRVRAIHRATRDFKPRE